MMVTSCCGLLHAFFFLFFFSFIIFVIFIGHCDLIVGVATPGSDDVTSATITSPCTFCSFDTAFGTTIDYARSRRDPSPAARACSTGHENSGTRPSRTTSLRVEPFVRFVVPW